MNISGLWSYNRRGYQCQCTTIIQDTAKEMITEQIFGWNGLLDSKKQKHTAKRLNVVKKPFNKNFSLTEEKNPIKIPLVISYQPSWKNKP